MGLTPGGRNFGAENFHENMGQQGIDLVFPGQGQGRLVPELLPQPAGRSPPDFHRLIGDGPA